MEKLTILADSAKYDVACTSSGVDRGGAAGGIGSAVAPGCCHTFSAGRPLREPVKGATHQRVRLRLRLLREGLFQPTCPEPPSPPGSWRS